MYYCCKGLESACSKSCNFIESCCSTLCDCLEKSCSGCFNCMKKSFKSPFSFCTFLAFFVSCIPFVLMLIATFKGSNIECSEKNIKMSLCVCGFINLVNFLFCVYLMTKYKEGNNNYQPRLQTETMLQKTANLLLYDVVTCLYIFFIIFELIWVYFSFNWVQNEGDKGNCKQQEGGIIMNSLILNLHCILLFFVGSAILFVMALCSFGCEDNSMGFNNCIYCILYVCSCGQCNLFSSNQQLQQPISPIRQRSRSRQFGRIRKFVNFIFGQSGSSSSYYQDNLENQQISQNSQNQQNIEFQIQQLVGLPQNIPQQQQIDVVHKENPRTLAYVPNQDFGKQFDSDNPYQQQINQNYQQQQMYQQQQQQQQGQYNQQQPK